MKQFTIKFEMKKTILSALFLLFISSLHLSAQSSSSSSSKQKKSVTIEKRIDKDGNEVIEKTIKEKYNLNQFINKWNTVFEEVLYS